MTQRDREIQEMIECDRQEALTSEYLFIGGAFDGRRIPCKEHTPIINGLDPRTGEELTYRLTLLMGGNVRFHVYRLSTLGEDEMMFRLLTKYPAPQPPRLERESTDGSDY
jgi:hypothetical protein